MDSGTRFFMFQFHASRLGNRMTSMEHLAHKTPEERRVASHGRHLPEFAAEGGQKEKLSVCERFCGRNASIGVKCGV